jgi:hypothetical protein
MASSFCGALAAAGTRRAQYLEGDPWPHLILDDLLDQDRVAAAACEARAIPNDAMVWQVSRRVRKASVNTLADLGMAIRGLLADLADSRAVAGLGDLTGVHELTGDPRLTYAGISVTPPGGWQKVHEDFPKHPVTGLWNRVAVLLYLNDWQPSHGGELELWPQDMSAGVKVIQPIAGRIVVFETTSAHRHGIRPVNAGAPARIAIGTRYYSPNMPDTKPRGPLRRSVRRPGESVREILPTLGEIGDYLRAFTAH